MKQAILFSKAKQDTTTFIFFWKKNTNVDTSNCLCNMLIINYLDRFLSMIVMMVGFEVGDLFN